MLRGNMRWCVEIFNDTTQLNDIISLRTGSSTLNDINYRINDRQFRLLMINRRLMI